MPIRTIDPFADLLKEIDLSHNPYVGQLAKAQETSELPVAFGPTLRAFPGHWRELAGINMSVRPQEVVVEIGCHNGRTLIDMAQAFPDVLFVGMDITYKRIISTAKKSKELGLKNVFVILANAGGMDQLFAAGEISGFVTFFPDPWKKKKHAHYRLYQETFCENVWQALKPGGFLWLKTDHEPYFQQASEFVGNCGFIPSSEIPIIGDLDFSSSFQSRFQIEGLPTYAQRWIKPTRTSSLDVLQ